MESTKIITHVYCYFFKNFFLSFNIFFKSKNREQWLLYYRNEYNSIYIGTYTNWCIFYSLTVHVLALFIYYFNGNLISIFYTQSVHINDTLHFFRGVRLDTLTTISVKHFKIDCISIKYACVRNCSGYILSLYMDLELFSYFFNTK